GQHPAVVEPADLPGCALHDSLLAQGDLAVACQGRPSIPQDTHDGGAMECCRCHTPRLLAPGATWLGSGLGLDGFRLFGVGGRLPVSAAFAEADPLGLPASPALGFHQEAAALGAASRDRLLPHDDAAVGVVGSAVEGLAPPGPALHQGVPTLGAVHPDLLQEGPGVPALGEARTGEEATVAAVLDHHLATALVADLVRLLVG